MKTWILFLIWGTGLVSAGVPEISGTDLSSGKPFRWERNQPTVLVFLSPTCPCSKSHEARLAALRREFPKVPFLGIVSNATGEAGPYFKSRLPFPVVGEVAVEWANAFAALNTPHAFVVSASGEILYQGGVDDQRVVDEAKPASAKFFLKEALEDVVAGRPVRVAQSRPLGCAIRR